MTIEPPVTGERGAQPSTRQRLAMSAIDVVLFGLSDLVPTRRVRRLVRAAIYGFRLTVSAPKLRQLPGRIQELSEQTRAASPRSRRLGLSVAAGLVTTAGLFTVGWYRLLVKLSTVLATHGVRFPRLIVGALGELALGLASARLRRGVAARQKALTEIRPTR